MDGLGNGTKIEVGSWLGSSESNRVNCQRLSKELGLTYVPRILQQ